MSVNKYDSETDTLTKVAGNATVPIDDVTPSDSKVYSSSKIEEKVRETYFTSEAKTNKVWITGKPIYSKFINLSSATTLGTSATSLGVSISNISCITNFYAYNLSDKQTKNGIVVTFNSTSGLISANVISSSTATTVIDAIYVEYTKSTD